MRPCANTRQGVRIARQSISPETHGNAYNALVTLSAMHAIDLEKRDMNRRMHSRRIEEWEEGRTSGA